MTDEDTLLTITAGYLAGKEAVRRVAEFLGTTVDALLTEEEV